MREDAVALWGEKVVAEALAHAAPAPLTKLLRQQVREHATSDSVFATWASSLPPAEFAAVVRLLCGETRLDLLDAVKAADARKAD